MWTDIAQLWPLHGCALGLFRCVNDLPVPEIGVSWCLFFDVEAKKKLVYEQVLGKTVHESNMTSGCLEHYRIGAPTDSWNRVSVCSTLCRARDPQQLLVGMTCANMMM